MKNEAIAELQVCMCVCVYTYTHTPTTRDISKNEVIKSYHRLESLYFFFFFFGIIVLFTTTISKLYSLLTLCQRKKNEKTNVYILALPTVFVNVFLF